MLKKSALMTRDELADILDNTGPHRFTVHGKCEAVEKDFATGDEPRPCGLTSSATRRDLPGERIRRIDAELSARTGTR